MKYSSAVSRRTLLTTGLDLLAGLFVLLCVGGCNRSTESNSAGAESTGNISANGIELTSSSTPTEVVNFVLAALDNKDLSSIEKVIASDKVQQDIEDITRGKRNKQFDALRNKAAAAAATGISLTLSFLKDGSRKVTGETIQGDNAEVTVEGATIDGNTSTKIVHLIKENGTWRLVPSRR